MRPSDMHLVIDNGLPSGRRSQARRLAPNSVFRSYDIAVVPGDGIGTEVCQAAMEVLRQAAPEHVTLNFARYSAGAEEYCRSGEAYPEIAFEACKRADAILHGAGGLPGVNYPDGVGAGTEFGLSTRLRLDLYANIRPVKLYAGVRSRLRDKRPGDIDYVIVRENTEGLCGARGGGVIMRNDLAIDTLVVTRGSVERVCRAAFQLARKRNGAPKDGRRRVTCCDKSDTLRSYALFRSVFDAVATEYPDVEADYALADAMIVHLIEQPERYDVIVAENMIGEMLSDLAAATVGGMGLAPSRELGDRHALFQPSHGSAPALAGRGVANPYATILSAAYMLAWLGEKHTDCALDRAGATIERAVEAALADGGRYLTSDLGGDATTPDVAEGVIRHLS